MGTSADAVKDVHASRPLLAEVATSFLQSSALSCANVGVEPGVGSRRCCEAASFGVEAAEDAAVR
jgi:hypothetical protein